MEDNGSTLLGRRRALHLLGLGITATGFLGLAACKQDSGGSGGGQPSQPAPPPPTPAATPAETAAAAPMDCNSPIDATSKTTRKVMQYKNPAASPDKKCSLCTQYQDAKYGACGGCKLFTGPVDPNGGCQSFAPKTPG